MSFRSDYLDDIFIVEKLAELGLTNKIGTENILQSLNKGIE